jgi:hypothetical protein
MLGSRCKLFFFSPTYFKSFGTVLLTLTSQQLQNLQRLYRFHPRYGDRERARGQR